VLKVRTDDLELGARAVAKDNGSCRTGADPSAVPHAMCRECVELILSVPELCLGVPGNGPNKRCKCGLPRISWTSQRLEPAASKTSGLTPPR
jgi:hypothetical protein